MVSPKERRRYTRLEIRLEVEYQTHGRISVYNKSATRNISEVGMAIQMHRFTKEKEVIDFALKVPTDYIPITGRGSVVWVRTEEENEENGPVTAAGLKFLQFDEEGKEKFFNFLKGEREKLASRVVPRQRTTFRLQPTP
jgi:c-di-GMP-binding flagellar brake protein YcgR